MARAAVMIGIAATVVAASVALGAGADVRLHRLHVPPPPAVDAGDDGAPAAPAPPDLPAPPAPVAPPPAPSPPPSPPSGIVCTTSGSGAPADVTGQLVDYGLSLAPAMLAAAPTLRVRGINQGSDGHTIALRPLGGSRLCATPLITTGLAAAFELTNVPPGVYQLFCTLHPSSMQATFTIS
jgi:plastocyanin